MCSVHIYFPNLILFSKIQLLNDEIIKHHFSLVLKEENLKSENISKMNNLLTVQVIHANSARGLEFHKYKFTESIYISFGFIDNKFFKDLFDKMAGLQVFINTFQTALYG